MSTCSDPVIRLTSSITNFLEGVNTLKPFQAFDEGHDELSQITFLLDQSIQLSLNDGRSQSHQTKFKNDSYCIEK